VRWRNRKAPRYRTAMHALCYALEVAAQRVPEIEDFLPDMSRKTQCGNPNAYGAGSHRYSL
jgi:hypothetical protein